VEFLYPDETAMKLEGHEEQRRCDLRKLEVQKIGADCYNIGLIIFIFFHHKVPVKEK